MGKFHKFIGKIHHKHEERDDSVSRANDGSPAPSSPARKKRFGRGKKENVPPLVEVDFIEREIHPKHLRQVPSGPNYYVNTFPGGTRYVQRPRYVVPASNATQDLTPTLHPANLPPSPTTSANDFFNQLFFPPPALIPVRPLDLEMENAPPFMQFIPVQHPPPAPFRAPPPTLYTPPLLPPSPPRVHRQRAFTHSPFVDMPPPPIRIPSTTTSTPMPPPAFVLPRNQVPPLPVHKPPPLATPSMPPPTTSKPPMSTTSAPPKPTRPSNSSNLRSEWNPESFIKDFVNFQQNIEPQFVPEFEEEPQSVPNNRDFEYREFDYGLPMKSSRQDIVPDLDLTVEPQSEYDYSASGYNYDYNPFTNNEEVTYAAPDVNDATTTEEYDYLQSPPPPPSSPCYLAPFAAFPYSPVLSQTSTFDPMMWAQEGNEQTTIDNFTPAGNAETPEAYTPSLDATMVPQEEVGPWSATQKYSTQPTKTFATQMTPQVDAQMYIPQAYASQSTTQTYAPQSAPQVHAPQSTSQAHVPQTYAPQPVSQIHVPQAVSQPAPQIHASQPAPQVHAQPAPQVHTPQPDAPQPAPQTFALQPAAQPYAPQTVTQTYTQAYIPQQETIPQVVHASPSLVYAPQVDNSAQTSTLPHTDTQQCAAQEVLQENTIQAVASSPVVQTVLASPYMEVDSQGNVAVPNPIKAEQSDKQQLQPPAIVVEDDHSLNGASEGKNRLLMDIISGGAKLRKVTPNDTSSHAHHPHAHHPHAAHTTHHDADNLTALLANSLTSRRTAMYEDDDDDNNSWDDDDF